LPLLDAGRYTLWMGLSQLLWIFAFALFLATFLRMLYQPRVDGQFG